MFGPCRKLGKKTVVICYIDIGPLLILFKLPLFTAVDNFPLLVLCHLPADRDGPTFIYTLVDGIITSSGRLSQKLTVYLVFFHI